ncbi:uncharacterized protein LOC132549354 [Ylistrum balloti]|uniref:uncharacterized protein LOC132549354 n=1 Tax=Ylistrum balloti TaxID=509963 RepID=UPI002905E5F1|nr:uncharacterized protein LOC132549354 [Ylistrum balloti]
MVEDSERHGRPVAYCYLKSEKKENISSAIRHFCKLNDTSSTTVAMVDKDLTEISVITEQIKDIKILLCTFHVMKYFKKKVSELEIKRDRKSSLMFLLSKLVYSPTASDYNENYSVLQKEFPEFIDYFDTNWHSCKEMWVHHFRTTTKFLGNHTNNKVESHNQKLKTYIKRNSHLSESIKGLFRFIKDSFDSIAKSTFNTLKTRVDYKKLNSVSDIIVNSCVKAAYDLIRPQLEKHSERDFDIRLIENTEKLEVTYQHKTYYVDRNMEQCSCTFYTIYCLPCQHIFACRKHLGVELFIQSLIPSKWQLNSKFDFEQEQEESPLQNIVLVKRETESTKKVEPLTEREKYNKAMEILKDMASFLATCGQEEFIEKI